MARPRPFVVGNWKMNGLRSSAAEMIRIVQGARALTAVDLMICPPATLLGLFASIVEGSPVRLGAQDCHCQSAPCTLRPSGRSGHEKLGRL